MRVLTVLALVALAACDSPGVAFMGSESIRVDVEGSVFNVHRREDRVEVYRTSREMLPRLSEVLGKSQIAIEQATGCKVKDGSLTGDHAIQRATLNCTGEPDTKPPGLTCDFTDYYDPDTNTNEVSGITCVPI